MDLIPIKKPYFNFKKAICGFMIFAILFTQFLQFPISMAVVSAATIDPANPPNDPKVVYDLIAVVVDVNIDKDSSSYIGLRNEYPNELNKSTISERIMRYAEDLRTSNNLTDVKILFFDKEKDSVQDLANALENLYINGDSTHNNRLAGAVFIGDIPMPVVNKSGNRFMSLFPYTDFDDKTYLYNPGTKSFEVNKDNIFPKPEIWHGIIRAPEDGINGMQALAEFFDKNHLYYMGVDEFAKFDKKLFFGDLVQEEQNMNEDSYKQYIKYLEYAEDMVYLRYNKFLANELSGSLADTLPLDEMTDFGKEFITNAMSGSALASMPDIYSKNVIDTFLLPYYKVFSNYISKINDFTEGTGRYKVSDVDSLPELITVKDEYTKYYLKAVNDALEKRINEIVADLEEPLPLLEKSSLSGGFLNEDMSIEDEFELQLSGSEFPPDYYLNPLSDILSPSSIVNEINYKFHYYNEKTETFYINGIMGDNLDDAKLCAPYLGSTKNEYYDENLNFNPKREGIDGDYSILTRSLKTDNISTAQIVSTIGVNTRLLSPEEASALTGGQSSNGALIEKNPESGAEAFIHNPFISSGAKYKNQLQEGSGLNGPLLKEGDIIVKINGETIDSMNPVELAIKNSYDSLMHVIKTINDGKGDELENFEYEIAIIPGESLSQTDIDSAVGNISIEFYRGNQKFQNNFTFTTDKNGKLGREDPKGNPELIVLFSHLGITDEELSSAYIQLHPGENNNVFETGSDGVIFPLYDTENSGYNNSGYDSSSGCNANSGGKNSDRCFPYTASVPIFDPAGSTTFFSTTIPGQNNAKLLFPENVNKSQENLNSGNAVDYQNHVYNFQFPSGYQYEDIDEVYYNYCFQGFPSVEVLDEGDDSNPYAFPLDPSTKGDVYNIDQDFYGRYLKYIGDFVNDQSDEDQKNGYSPNVFPSIDASQIVLNNIDGVVTLKDFSDRYGLFDGIDNDGNDIIDYFWEDKNLDGVYETRTYDVKEAEAQYGIPSSNLLEISRKMLSHESSYILPEELSPFDKDIVLNVSPTPYKNTVTNQNKKISSIILHNEPTFYTITEQLKSMGALSLPIDNPRYVAFMASPKPFPDYSDPHPINANPPINVEAILAKLILDAPYFSGEIEKIYYPNLFDYSNYAELGVALDQTAWDITKVYGSYKLKNGLSPIDCSEEPATKPTCKEIHDFILNSESSVIGYTGEMDNPNDFDIQEASVKKIYDAFEWNNLNIDQKHEYILERYLNDDENAFIKGSDMTLFPAPAGYNLGYGYEAAYLVLDGKKDYFNMNFNKDLPEETNENFDPLALIAASAEGEDQGGEGGAPGEEGGGGGGGDDGFEFVWLDQFLKETMDFFEWFVSPVSEFEECCGYADNAKKELDKEKAGVEEPSALSDQPLKTLDLTINKDAFYAGSTDKLIVTIKGYDENGTLVGIGSNNQVIALNILQNNDAPIFEFSGSSSKNLAKGVIEFSLTLTENIGNVVVFATAEDNIQSNSEEVKVTSRRIELNSYTYFVPEGMDELVAYLDEQKKLESAGGGEGEGGDGDGSGDGSGGEVTSGDGSGNGSGGEVTSGDGSSNGSGGEVTSGDGSEEVISGDGSGGEVTSGDGSGDGNGGEVTGGGDGDTGDKVNGSGGGDKNENEFDKNLKKILKEKDESGKDGTGNETDSGSGGEEDKDIEILESTPVEEITLDSTPVEGEETTEETVPAQKWEEYFIIKDYYKKFLENYESNLSTNRLLAEVYSDRLLAYIPDKDNPFIDAENNEETKYIVETNDQMVADNESLMMIQASVFDIDGNLETKSNKDVRFSIESEIPNIVTFENGNIVTSIDGVATAYLRAGKKIGHFKLLAEVLDANGNRDKLYPIAEKELDLVAGEAVCVVIETDSCTIPANVDPCDEDAQLNSCVLVANNQSKTKLKVSFRDKFNNLANNSIAQASLIIEDENKMYFDEKADTNTQIIGTQVSTIEGFTDLDLYAKDDPGETNIIALLMDYELEDKFIEAGDNYEEIDFSMYPKTYRKFELLDQVSLNLSLNKQAIPADGDSLIKITSSLLHDGQIVKNYNGPINFTILNENLGKFESLPSKNMVEGVLHEENVKFNSSTLTGEAEILVDIPGFVSDTIKFNTLPQNPYKIELTSSKDTIYSDGIEDATLEAKLLDKNGNLVNTEKGSGILVTFETTPATSGFLEFPNGHSAVSLKGTASLKVKGKAISGKVNIIANAEGINAPALFSIDITKHITKEKVNDFLPRVLYMSLLGGDFGNFDENKNLSEAFLYSKKIKDNKISLNQIQAISSVTATPDDKKRLFSIDSYGKIDILSDTISSKTISATDSFPYQKISLSDSSNENELGSIFLIPKANTKLYLLKDDEELNKMSGDGIYVKRLSQTDKEIQFIEKDDGLYIDKGGETKAKIDKFGRISINDELFEMKLPEESDNIISNNFTLLISDKSELLAAVSYNQNFATAELKPQDVKYITYDGNLGGAFPGVYFKSNTSSSKYGFVYGFSRASTDEGKSFYLLDLENEIDPMQAPGLGFKSLESAKDSAGVGFDGDNKHMLFFAAGNSIGESHVPYASEVLAIYGDPNVRLKIDGIVGLISQLSGYTKTIEKSIYTSDEDITEIVEFDYNGDDRDDLLLVYEDGRIRLLESEISNKHFKDRGYILNIFGGIYSSTKIDVNNDGYDDLVVGTQENCTKAEGEQPVTLFVNNNGSFEKKTLNLTIEGKLFEMESDDMNSDGCDDLVTSDSAGNIRIFYNTNDGEVCTGLETNYGYTKNYGYEINSDKNLKENLFIYYNGMEQLNLGNPDLYYADSNSNKFVTFALQSSTPPASVEEGAEFAADATAFQAALLNNPGIASLDLPPQTYPKEYNFIHITEDSVFGIETVKQAIDVNGETVNIGDKINYVVSLKNKSGNTINNLMLSDFTPANMTLDLKSLECLDNNCPDQPAFEETGISLRSAIIKNISVSANGTRMIKYSMTVNEVPKINFDIGDFDKKNYSDIFVKPSVNPDGVLTYLYSKENLLANGYADFNQVLQLPEAGEEELPFGDLIGELDKIGGANGISADANGKSNVPLSVKKKTNALLYQTQQDADYDGCSDSWGGLMNNAQSAGEALAGSVESLVSALRCSGGCLPIPYNFAFLTPNTPVEGVPGIPVFSWGHSWPFGIGFFVPTSVPSGGGRIYVSPTLTGGLGLAACIGPSIGGVSPCYAYAVPLLQSLGVCDAISGKLNKAIAAAKNTVTNPDIGMSTVVSDGSGGADTDTAAKNFAYSDPDFPISAAGSVNIKIPGFPSVITNWMDKQTDEIYNKLLDFPTFYFIYPDFKTLMGNIGSSLDNFTKEKIKNLHDVLRAINSIPLIQIEGKEVLIKIPALSQAEIEKWKRQGQAWIEYEKNQIDKAVGYFCTGKTAFNSLEDDENRKTLCDKFFLDLDELIQSVRTLMDKLDQIANLPRDILNWRTMESKYASQIICYLDAIMQFTGGYIKRQQKIVESWMQAAEDAIRTFKGWKALLDLILDYQTSCDKCKNDRYSKLGLLMQLFVAIPEPPIIPFPKWPDIVVDVSQIKMGSKIIWPDLVFRPESIKLPNLPYFTFPDLFPDAVLKIPGFDLPDWLLNFPNFVLPDLPDLPSFSLPKLPDLPRPPKIPKIPEPVLKLIANVKIIFKILCLLKNGFIPVPEGKLGTEIETLTQPTVQAVLPIIAQLGVQLPAIQYDFVEQIRATIKLDVGIDLSSIYLIVRKGAEKMNKAVEKVIGFANKYLSFNLQRVIDAAIKEAEERAQKAIAEGIAAGVEAAGEAVEGAVEGTAEAVSGDESASLQLSYFDSYYNSYLSEMEKSFEEINTSLDEYIASIGAENNVPDTYYLAADTTYLDPSDPLLNRTIEEIEADIQNYDLPDSPELNRLANIRDALIAYTKDLDSSNDILMDELDNYNEFSKILVDTDQNITEKLASLSFEGDLSSNNKTAENSFSFLGEALEEAIKDSASFDSKNLIALNADFDPISAAQSYMSGGDGAKAAPKGFYIIVGDKNESVLSYTSELGKTVHTLFTDVDNDTDSDIIYTLGGDVYFKENYKSNPQGKYLEKGEVILGNTNNSVSDYSNSVITSVQGLNSPYENNKKADISWTSAGEDIVAYEVLIKKSLLHKESDAFKRYIALINPVSDEKSQFILDELDINSDSDFIIELTNSDFPSISIEIENGNYYVSVYAFDKSGNKSFASNSTIVAPQVCADQDAPFPALSQDKFELSIFKELEIDASGSFDPSGEISEYFLETPDGSILWSDLNSAIDEDGDNIVWNDRNNPKFKIGPFENKEDLGIHSYILNVLDKTRNSSEQKVDINVFVPKISLDDTFSRTYIATGSVDPKVPAFPFSLIRSRYVYRTVDNKLAVFPRIEKITTPSVGEKEKYYTNGSGEYEISDLNLEDMILVENSDGKIIAEIHPDTGDIGAFKDGYSSSVIAAIPPTSPTTINILDSNGNILGSVYKVADPNTDVTIFKEINFNSENYKDLKGVNVSDLNISDNFEWYSFDASDVNYPGGAALVNKIEKKQVLLVDTAGNVLVLDKKVSLRQKKNDHTKDPLVIEVLFEETVIAEIYIAVSNSAIIVGPNDVPFATPRGPSASSFYGEGNMPKNKLFEDIDDDFNKVVSDLYNKDIIEGTETDDGLVLNGDENIKRSEFVKALLKMLCIIPREPDAYLLYKAGEGESGGGFSDIEFADGETMPWYYPYVKEADLLGLIHGYKGEKDPVTGLYPFKPENTITRAEAVNIILEALEFKGVLNLGGLTIGDPWYVPFVKAAQDLTPYINEGYSLKNNFIITPEEAAAPNKEMTRKELILMANRVLELYNCFEIDNDHDGMSDFCEEKYKISDPDADQDKDELINSYECYYGYDPTDKDTDQGGVLDGKEVKYGTNPLDPTDDPADDDNDGLSTLSEILVYGTDPYDPDTDDGGVNDGDEVKNLINPLDGSDDSGEKGVLKEGESGLYLVPANCTSCPCISTFLHKADIIKDDIFYTVISTYDESYIFSKSNEVVIE